MAEAAAPLLTLEQVSIDFGPQRVLRDVSWQVNRGETVVVIGESGCGKTCVLKLLIGLLTPTRGRIWFDGRSWVDLAERDLVKQRLRFGFLFQGAALFDSLTVFENVAFSLKEQKRANSAGIREIVRQRLREVGLSDSVENLKPAELSGGMKKRVGLARALAVDPEVMLYDEPTTGLDPIMTDVINELILQTRRSRPVTSVVVTHEMRTVHKVADRVIMLVPLAGLGPGEPQVIFDGPPAELTTSPDVRVRQFALGEARPETLDAAH
ncbi:MAG TPA: ATP-binding cassette domain-containing protein [Gemmataceae bacterium]|jgi:phospholipid/cholesterol/gamma-HCH transport system ATP-binding protein|nr:ATP-binding cassette domain-containing protein [Gemmataceae bacterium]